MKIIIKIPDEFVSDFLRDQFKDSLERIKADACCMCCLTGLYDIETINMLIEALEKATVFYQ